MNENVIFLLILGGDVTRHRPGFAILTDDVVLPPVTRRHLSSDFTFPMVLSIGEVYLSL